MRAPKILIGHSLGGAAVLQAAARIPSSLAVITIAAPADPNHVSLALGDSKEIIERRGEAKVDLAGRTFKIKKQFLDDLESVSMQETIQNLNRALVDLSRTDRRCRRHRQCRQNFSDRPTPQKFHFPGQCRSSADESKGFSVCRSPYRDLGC